MLLAAAPRALPVAIAAAFLAQSMRMPQQAEIEVRDWTLAALGR